MTEDETWDELERKQTKNKIKQNMNERIKELAEQAGCVQHEFIWVANNFDMERFAELVRQDEREKCAKLFVPTHPRPCDCDICDCGNKADAVGVAEWDMHALVAKSIRGRTE
jgi:hypothetical protein